MEIGDTCITKRLNLKIEIGNISRSTDKNGMRYRKEAQKAKDTARQRMERLFRLAAEESNLHPERSDRYVQIAHQISSRTRVRIPLHLKRLFCKHCDRYISASGARVRLREGVLTITCLRCGEQTRRPYRYPKHQEEN